MPSTTIYSGLATLVAFLTSLVYLLWEPALWRYEVFGLNRPPSKIENVHGMGLVPIPDTIACEDIHYHVATDRIFGVTETDALSRFKFFPPIAVFKDVTNLNTGQIFVLNPHTLGRTTLTLENFSGPFITHGIDIYTPPSYLPDTVYIFAVNHLPHPDYSYSSPKDTPNVPPARSQIELFRHTIGSESATHVRSIRHPLIATPNDIYAINDRTFYVTNDHKTRSGLMRVLEDGGGHEAGAWSDVIHVSISSEPATSPEDGVTAKVALDKTHNPNGLGHNPKGDIVLGRAAAGVMEIHKALSNGTLERKDWVRLPTTIDNPSYFSDPYARETGRDASGYVLACLTRAVGFPEQEPHPVSVWLLRDTKKPKNPHRPAPAEEPKGIARKGPRFDGSKAGWEVGVEREGGWVHKLIFQDDGHIISTASTAVIVAIDPKENGGKKEGWLFVVGPLAKGGVRTKIEL